MTEASYDRHFDVNAKGAFLEQVRERDELSHRLVLKLLAEQVARASEIEAVLA